MSAGGTPKRGEGGRGGESAPSGVSSSVGMPTQLPCCQTLHVSHWIIMSSDSVGAAHRRTKPRERLVELMEGGEGEGEVARACGAGASSGELRSRELMGTESDEKEEKEKEKERVRTSDAADAARNLRLLG